MGEAQDLKPESNETAPSEGKSVDLNTTNKILVDVKGQTQDLRRE